MSDSTAIFRQACLAEVSDRIRNQVLVNRLTANSSKITKISWWECWYIIGEIDVDCLDKSHAWRLRVNMYNLNDSFAASRKLSGNSEQVFINQLNFRPTSKGKHNSMGHLLPCAIDSKKSPTHTFAVDWDTWHGNWVAPCYFNGASQPEVTGETIVCSDTSVWRTLLFTLFTVTVY